MSPENIFRTQLVLAYLAWSLCFATYFWPRLKTMDGTAAQRVIATVHSFRFLGLVFTLPGVVGANLPASFATLAAYGDATACVLALLALLSFRMRPLFWTFVVAFNVVGFSDILLAYYHAIAANLPASAGQLGGMYFVVILYVPLLMITHISAVLLWLRPRVQQAAA